MKEVEVREERAVPAASVVEERGAPAAAYKEATQVAGVDFVDEASVASAAYKEATPVGAVDFVDEASVPVASYEDEATVAAADFLEEAPVLQGNAVVDEEALEDVRSRTDVVGSVAVSDGATVGGGVRVGDDSVFKRNLTVEGWLIAENIGGKIKEWLENIEAIAKDAKDTADDGSLSVRIVADKGNVLHNGEGELELSAHVYYRGEEVTERLYEGRFSWKRSSTDTTGDRLWNRLHEGTGSRCIVTDEDVDRNAVFTCEVDVSGTFLGD